jgi:hypothetical protein
MALIDKNIVKEERAARIGKHLPGIEVMYKQAIKSDPGAPIRLEKAWQSFTKAFGKASSPVVIKGMNIFSSLLEKTANNLSHFSMFDNLSKQGTNVQLGPPITYDDFKDSAKKFVHHPLKTLEEALHHNTLPPLTNSPLKMGNVYFDSNKVGQVMFPVFAKMMNRGGVSYGTSTYSIPLTPTPNSFNGN